MSGGDDFDPTRLQQGTEVDCAYCTVVRPGVGAGCPCCGGEVRSFRPARMMTPDLARRELLDALLRGGDPREPLGESGAEGEARREAAVATRRALVGLLERVRLHGFDLERALVEAVLQLEEEEDLTPPGS